MIDFLRKLKDRILGNKNPEILFYNRDFDEQRNRAEEGLLNFGAIQPTYGLRDIDSIIDLIKITPCSQSFSKSCDPCGVNTSAPPKVKPNAKKRAKATIPSKKL